MNYYGRKFTVLWDMTPCSCVKRYNILEEPTASFFKPEDGDRFLQYVGTYLANLRKLCPDTVRHVLLS
jgi:hypothetical protein